MIAIVDYQMGNLRSVQKAFECKGFDARITESPADIAAADGVVLPGVGAFGDCYKELRARNLIEPLREYIRADRPFLGICLGLQLLFDWSEENGGAPGLQVVHGDVRRFARNGVKVPHMGWNQVSYSAGAGGEADFPASPIFEGIPPNSYFYFVHSYYVNPEDRGIVAGWTEYGVPFASAIWRGNLFATQFHPEKSQEAGLRVIENFGTLSLRARAQTARASL